MRSTRRQRILVDGGVNPIYRRMLRCTLSAMAIDLQEVDLAGGRADRKGLEAAIGNDTAAILLQNPNFFGTVDDLSDVASLARAAGAFAVISVYPISLGMLKAPGDMGADIVTGEGQSLGLPLSFGGPYLGFLATRKAHVRRMPGRLTGKTKDRHGNDCYVLTLQAREQHIRREKATSNICSNQALCALRALIYLSLLGRGGMVELAETCARKAAYARKKLAAIPGVAIAREPATFNEFVVSLPCDAGEVVSRLMERGIAAGLPLGRDFPGRTDQLLIAVTEKRTQAEIDGLAEALAQVL